MIISLLLGACAVAAGVVIVKHWREIVSWIKEFVTVLKGLFSTTLRSVAHAARVFVQKFREGMAGVMHNLYYQENGEWVEEIRTRKISENELPDWVKEDLSTNKTNITKRVEQEMQLTLV